ncbi:histidinolphosphatase, partial [Ascosphaera atra]
MRVIPFPFRLNIGSDVVHLPRIYRLFAGRHRDRFVRRILCDHELRDFEQRFINAQSLQNHPTP